MPPVLVLLHTVLFSFCLLIGTFFDNEKHRNPLVSTFDQVIYKSHSWITPSPLLFPSPHRSPWASWVSWPLGHGLDASDRVGHCHLVEDLVPAQEAPSAAPTIQCVPDYQESQVVLCGCIYSLLSVTESVYLISFLLMCFWVCGVFIVFCLFFLLKCVWFTVLCQSLLYSRVT